MPRILIAYDTIEPTIRLRGKRWMLKKIARQAGKDTDTSKNHEYTNWKAVDQFVSGFLSHLAAPRP